MKMLIKNIFGYFKAKLNNIKYTTTLYIGLNVKIINKGSIQFGEKCNIRGGGRIYTHSCSSSLVIADGCDIGELSTISAYNIVKIGKNVLTGPHVYIADHNHEYKDITIPVMFQREKWNEGDRIEIGDGTWLGTNVVVVGNVHIGKNCVIGANSVVTKDIPDYCVAAGIPAKIIKKYDLGKDKWEKINENSTFQ